MEKAIEEFVARWNEYYFANYRAQFSHLVEAESHFAISGGRKYAKVWCVERGVKTRIAAFIDKASGDILKPAGLNAPAKHARGNVKSERGGLEAVSHGGMSIRYL